MMRNTSAMTYGITTGLLLLLYVAPGMAVAQASAGSPQTPASLPGTAISVAEVATQATEVSKFLRTLSAQIISSPAIDTIQRVLPEASGTIDLELAMTSTMLQGQPTLELLQAQQQLWQRRHLQTTGWLHVLTGQATHQQKVGHQLTALHTTWTATRTAAQQAQAPETILQQIDATLAAIAAAQTPLEVQRAAVLDLQRRVAHEVARCEKALAQIAQVQQQAVTGMLVRDGLPLWRAALWKEARTALPDRGPGNQVVLVARWSLLDRDAKELALRTSRLSQAVGEADYEATVTAMGRALEVLAQDMATTLRSLTPPAPAR